MFDYKIFIGVITIVLAFVGYFPYIRDTLFQKITPHTFTWFIWSLAVSISAALQIKGGAGIGAWTTVAVAVLCVSIFSLSFLHGSGDITTLDVVFFGLALASLFLWVVVNQPVLSAILIVLTDILGFGPTVRKSWKHPHSETLSLYMITTVRHGLSILALRQFNILTALYPIAWTVANFLFSVFLIVRRRAVHNQKPAEVAHGH